MCSVGHSNKGDVLVKKRSVYIKSSPCRRGASISWGHMGGGGLGTHVVVGPEQVSAGGTVTPETTRRRGRTPRISRRN